jgi:hypothetical protein
MAMTSGGAFAGAALRTPLDVERGLGPAQSPEALSSEPLSIQGLSSEASTIEPSWARRSALRRWFGSGSEGSAHAHTAEPARGVSSSRRPRKGPLAFPSLSDAVYAASDAGPESEPPEASSREAPSARRAAGFPWATASLGIAAVAGVAVLVSTFGGARQPSSARARCRRESSAM